ncbi:MAG: lipoprotein-releasing ABC transporter permease subunit [Gammaproteobacteria bacterium]|nr:lipoprotein-releasing ABC transporter permease subunit [Gammaproteobacteria bacterium]
MFQPLELSIGLRYTRAKRRNHFISFISLASMLGVALGVIVLITVISVMNGFGNELRDRILGVVAHVTVSEVGQQLGDWQNVAKVVEKKPMVVATAPYIDGEGMLVQGKNTQGVMVRGIDPGAETKVSDVNEYLMSGDFGQLKAGSFGIVIGSTLAWKLNIDTGSQVTLMIPQALATPAGVLPRFKRFTVVGVFNRGIHEYDSALVLMHLDDAARLFQMKDRVSGLRLRLNDLDNAFSAAKSIQAELGGSYYVYDWTRKHANFFRAIKMEKRVMIVVLFFIVVVAVFNIVSTLVMVVTDKQADIAILRTLGLSPFGIMKIFMVQGTVIGTVGTIAGTVLGTMLALNVEDLVHFIEYQFGTKLIPADVYMIPDLPSEVYFSDVAVIAVVSFLMSVLATIYPAWRASQVEPAQALRYE